PVCVLPSSAHLHQRPADLLGRNLGIRSCKHKSGLPLGNLEQLSIANNVCHAETGQTCLPGAEEFSGPTKFEIQFCDLESIVRVDHGLQASLPFFRHFAPGHQDAIRLCCAATDTATELMKLRQTKPFSMLDHHDCGIGHVNTDLDHRRRYQNL